jgi:hypothetical protein
MRKGLICSAGIWLGVCLASSFAQPVSRPAIRPRGHAFLPPAFAGTPASLQVEAVAKYLVAQGDLAESVAIARKIHAEAAAQEMENWVNYVDAYFKRRELWRQWRRKENPSYIDREAHRQEIIKRRIQDQYQDVVRGDVTQHLNWLLTELFGPMAYQCFAGYQSPSDWPVDDSLKKALQSAMEQDLRPEDLHLIRFKAGDLEFPANQPKVLAGFWPPGLRGPEFEAARIRFEKARDDVLAELKSKGEVSHQSGENLVGAVNDLLVTLDKVYSPEDRRVAAVSLTYHESKRYLRSLLLQVYRVIRTHDQSIFDGTLCFQGGTILELLQHMYQTGVVFAPPEGGDDRVYRSLMTNMRNIYLALGSERASSE